jgi:hypothetical protein
MTATSRRSPAPGGRPHSVMVALSEMEMALVKSASVREGMAAGAWLGKVGVRAAEAVPGPASAWGPVMQELMNLRAELMENRRVLRNVGGNLNDVARAANSTGESHESASRVLALVARVVARVEETVGGVDELTVRARQEQLRVRP